ncbi:MAG: glycosyltransferase family 1 protein [Gemmatimonadaceae bacterium]
MQIGIDASRLLREQRGMGRYVRNLLRELPLVRSNISFIAYVRDSSEEAPMRSLLKSIGETAGRAEIAPAAQLQSSSADVVWFPWNFVTQPTDRAAIAVTIHDIAPMVMLDGRWWKVLKRIKYRRRYTYAIDQADAVLADSAFTVQEISRAIKPDMSKVHEVLLASDDFVAKPTDEAPILKTLGISGPFLMAVGASDARKNLSVLIAAMHELDQRGQATPLVLCGPGKRLESTGGTGSPSWLKYAGFVSDSELSALYRRSIALVFPSLYEGFGLPVLEAMQCGGRVICANASSLPQVAGDAALLFPPRDASALADQMQRLLADSVLRNDLTKRGLAQCQKFRWKLTAQKSLEAFDAAIARRKQRPA